MLKRIEKKSFDELTITEKDAEIKKLEKKLERKTVLYKISIPLTIISMISTVVCIVVYLLDVTQTVKFGVLFFEELMIGLLVTSFVPMIICVHVFVPVYWVKFIRSAYNNISENLSGDIGIDLIVTGIFVSVPAAIVIVATFFAPGFYCLKRTSDLKKSVAELKNKIESYKSKTYPYDGDFEIISAYKM